MNITGLLFSETSTIVVKRGNTVDVQNYTSGAKLHAEGLLANSLWQVALGNTASDSQAVVRSIAKDFADSFVGQHQQLSPSVALRLIGFGTLFLELTGRCNERCLHCYAGSGPEVTDSLERETCEGILRDAQRLGFQRIQFTGGDPLLHKDLEPLLSYASSLGLSSNEIYTNGLALTPALLARLAPHKPDFALSFYSSNPAVHDSITQVKGSQARTIRAIEYIQNAGLDLRLSVIVMEENSHDFEDTAQFLREKGLSFGWSGTAPVGRGNAFSTPKAELAESESKNESVHRRDDAISDFSTATPKGTLAVSSTGNVYPCIFNRKHSLGNVHQRTLREVVESPSLKRSLKQQDGQLMCLGCQMTDSALGMLRQAGG